MKSVVLDFSNKNISDKSILKYLPLNDPSIIELDLSDNELTQIKFIQNFPQIEILNLSGNNLSSKTDLKTLNKLENLSELYLRQNQIPSIAFLKNSRLKILDLTEIGLKSIKGIGQLSSLEELYLTSNSISDISELKNLRNLKILSISDTKVDDLTVLTELPKLREVNLTDLEDLTPSSLRVLNGSSSIEKIYTDSHLRYTTQSIEYNIRTKNNKEACIVGY
ncbi:leucine-rich repeat domain-containing protein [Candidatus Jidaibacter acanthamoebae]|nr:leucine-rich repeat domain-containing protein [Candidatus Jidaibacter acanthamoeba]